MQQLILYAYLIYLVLSGGLSVGSMLIYMSAVGQFAGAFNNLVNGYLDLSKHSLNIQEMMEVMSIPLKQERNDTIEPELGKDFVIEFRDVSFRYPGSERYAIDHLNLILRSNEKLCVVGENGSGVISKQTRDLPFPGLNDPTRTKFCWLLYTAPASTLQRLRQRLLSVSL